MKCASCGYNSVPEGARVCPECEQELPQGNASPVTINVEQNVGRVEEGGTVTGVTLEEPKGPVTVILNITIKLFEPLLAFLERYWPILVAILISDVVVLAAYLYLDPTFWIRRWVLVGHLILVPVILVSSYKAVRLARSGTGWRSTAALTIAAFLVLLGVAGWQLHWVFESPWRAIAVAQFDDSKATNKTDVQTDIITAMSQAGIPEEQIVRLGLISSPKTAIRLGRKYKAKIVMWGWYNDLEIHPNYEVVKLLPKIDLPETYKGTSEEELARFQLYLTRDLPSEYVALGFLTMGVIDYYDEKFEETLQSLEKAEDMLPESSRTISPRYFFLYRGNAFRRLQRYQDAVEEFDRAIALDPDNGDAIGVFLYKQRGLAYLNLGENEKAIADFDKSLGWEREQAVVFYNRGSAYYGLDLFDAALADFDQALAIQPSQNWAHFVYAMRGATYTHLARYEEALADANRAIELAQDASSGYFVRSVVYFKMGRLEMALADANKAIELDPRYIGAYYYRGQSYENLGDLRSARQDYQTAMDICATVGENDGVYTVHCERYGEEAMHGAQRVEEQLQ